MEIKAKFKGRDGSEGYANGATYRLIFGVVDNITEQRPRRLIEIWRITESPGLAKNPVRYSSLKAFLNNWQVIG